jgi:drug/metabolite transporter superfamily protein YnfA
MSAKAKILGGCYAARGGVFSSASLQFGWSRLDVKFLGRNAIAQLTPELIHWVYEWVN